jgi:MaoC like domain
VGVPPNSRRGVCGFFGRDLSSRARPASSDPEFTSAAGFPRPILHGLRTYGTACKTMAETLLDGDTSRVGSYGARSAGVVLPGETLEERIWKEGDVRRLRIGWKTDAHDAAHLVRLPHLGQIVEAAIPTQAQEATRDLARAWKDCRQDLMTARHRVSKMPLRQGII